MNKEMEKEYNRVCKIIDTWDDWKKIAYDELFSSIGLREDDDEYEY